MKKIEKLTPEQEAQMVVIRDKWLNRFKSGWTDKEVAEVQIKWLYDFCKLKEPEVIFVESPMAAQVLANKLLGNTKLNFESFAAYGSCRDYGWVAFYDYFESIGLEIKNDGFTEFKKLLWSGVYDMIQYDTTCIAVTLPKEVHQDSKNRLHNDSKAAIIFGDGYSQWYWKGTNVPQHWIEAPSKISLDELKTKNTEKRRVLIEILGVADYYKKLGGGDLDLLDQDIDNQGLPMKLYTFPFEGRKIQMLECVCPSTKRVYNIPPPNQSSRNVWDAKASICQLTEQECRELVNES